MDKKLWEEAVKFHGHECAGLAIGMKACEVIIDEMNVDREDKIICIAENKTCPLDGIRSVFGCDYDKKNLFYREGEELAFNIYNRQNNDSMRVVYKGKNPKDTKEEYMKYVLESDNDDLFDVGKVKYNLSDIYDELEEI